MYALKGYLTQKFLIILLSDNLVTKISSLVLSNLSIGLWFGHHLQVSDCTFCKQVEIEFKKMINIVSKSGNLAPYLKASTQTIASQLKPLHPAVTSSVKILVPSAPETRTSYSLSKNLPSGPVHVVSGPGGKTLKYFLILEVCYGFFWNNSLLYHIYFWQYFTLALSCT